MNALDKEMILGIRSQTGPCLYLTQVDDRSHVLQYYLDGEFLSNLISLGVVNGIVL